MDVGMSGMPVGDPDAMRTFALRLRKRAERIAARSSRVGHRVERMRFEGPAAASFRQRMLTARRSAEAAAAELKEIANYVLTQAARLETEIEEWRRFQLELARRAEGQ